MAPDKVILVGDLHFDPDGPARLEKVLNHYAPDAVSLELDSEDPPITSLDGIDFSRVLSRLTKSVVNSCSSDSDAADLLSSIEVSLGSAIKSETMTKNYCLEKGIPYYEIDSVSAASEIVGSAITEDFLVDFLLTYAVPMDTLRKKISDGYSKNFTFDTTNAKNRIVVIDRDRHMAEQILKIDTGVLIHISGKAHIFGNYFNLTDRLRKAGLEVEAIKLCEADNL